VPLQNIRKKANTNNLLLLTVKKHMMKTMTCKQLGGACEKEFHASSFEEMASMSKKHAMEMFQSGDQEHIKMMNEMQKLMSSPEAMKEWFENKRKEFEMLPGDK
jgi:hypothetical protein